jgi:hypothetical protein
LKFHQVAHRIFDAPKEELQLGNHHGYLNAMRSQAVRGM